MTCSAATVMFPPLAAFLTKIPCLLAPVPVTASVAVTLIVPVEVLST